MARLYVIDAGTFVIVLLERRSGSNDAHLRILDEEVELFLAIAHVILVETIVEVVACVLCADVVGSEGLWIWLLGWGCLGYGLLRLLAALW